jgi:hypothetical protein
VTESLQYTVEQTIGDIEIRNYPKFLIATVDSTTDEGAFRVLFGYISGNNKSRQEVPMTVPVISTKGSHEEISMTTPVISTPGSFSFVMPSRYTIDTIPEPTDKRIRIVEVESKRLAVLGFKGRTNREKVDSKEAELTQILSEKDIKIIGEAFLMRYNSPFTPGFMRRNEIAVEIEAQTTS